MCAIYIQVTEIFLQDIFLCITYTDVHLVSLRLTDAQLGFVSYIDEKPMITRQDIGLPVD